MIHIFLSICIFLSSVAFSVTSYYETYIISDYLLQLDVVSMLEEYVDQDLYKIIKKSETFERIVYDYMKAYLHQEENYVIDEELSKAFFNEYASRYPELSFLSKDALIEFLMSQVDLNDYLPSFDELPIRLPKLIPSKYFLYAFIITFLIDCVLRKRISVYSLMLSCIFQVLMLFYLLELNYPNDFEILFIPLHNRMKYLLMVIWSCLILEWGQRYAKKIFLF